MLRINALAVGLPSLHDFVFHRPSFLLTSHSAFELGVFLGPGGYPYARIVLLQDLPP